VSFRNHLPVLTILGHGFPITISIVLGGAITYLTLGLVLGTTAALRRGSAVDRFSIGFSLTGASMQIFVLGLVLISIVVYQLGWLPRPAYTPLLQNPWDFVRGMLLPWATLGFINSAVYSRLSRAQMLETLSEDFVRTARAKGASLWTVNYRHALRAAITPIVTVFGLQLGGNSAASSSQSRPSICVASVRSRFKRSTT
jgi:peptide/nickel transport system permease protein